MKALEKLKNERDQALELMIACAITGNKDNQKKYMEIYHTKLEEYTRIKCGGKS